MIGYYFIGKLNSSSSIVDMKILPQSGSRKVGHGQRHLRLYGLFGGKKDGDDSPNKVS